MRAARRRGRFNICTGVPTSDLQLHALVAGAAGKPAEPDRAPARPGDIPAMVGDPSEAAAGLGWSPGTSLAEGIAATVDWMRLRLDARPDGGMDMRPSTETRSSTRAG
jgi:UDP-glucose 4-epimerase